jgi:hypothetical protein
VVLLEPTVELEEEGGGVCALAIVTIIDNESKSSPITDNKSSDMVLV